MSRFRLVVLDMDGTLLTDRKEITPRTAAAIRAGMARGVRFLLATARPWCSTRPFAEALGLDTPLICFNGALVREAGGGARLADRPIDAGTAAEMAAFCRERGLYVKVFGDDILYVEEATEETRRYSPRYRVPFREVGDMAAFIAGSGLSPYAFVVHSRAEEIPVLREEMEARWAGSVAGDCPNEHAIHFTDARASKLAAVRALAKGWGIGAEETLAVGNGGNDLDVIRWAGLGVAVANSPAEVLAGADAVTASNDEEGVAVALERYLGAT